MDSKGWLSKRGMKWVLSAIMVPGSYKKLENSEVAGKKGRLRFWNTIRRKARRGREAHNVLQWILSRRWSLILEGMTAGDVFGSETDDLALSQRVGAWWHVL